MKKTLFPVLISTVLAFGCKSKPTENSDTSNTTSSTQTVEATDGIKFNHESWANILATAKKENKLIFLDISASWCGPCKMLKKNTFPNKAVGDFYNANFISAEVDGEVGEGINLAQQFEIEGYPSLIFVNGDGQLVYKMAGYLEPNDFIKLGNEVLNATKKQ